MSERAERAERGSVLLVEDDVVDQMSVQRSFKDLKIVHRLGITENGIEALKYLRDDSVPRPFLILLDLNMPKMNGLEFLRELRKDEKLKMLPVVVLTSSKEERDRIESFGLNVAGYMLKPVDYPDFVEVIRTIDEYWAASEVP
jgi:CheY-like chemotaxis protein